MSNQFNRNYKVRVLPCEDYKYPDDCNRNYKCHYDYEMERCRQKSPPIEKFIYQDIGLPIDVQSKIYGMRSYNLIDLYPYFDDIQTYIENAGDIDALKDEIVQFLNYLPDLKNSDYWFINRFTRVLFDKFGKKVTYDLIGKSKNKDFDDWYWYYKYGIEPKVKKSKTFPKVSKKQLSKMRRGKRSRK